VKPHKGDLCLLMPDRPYQPRSVPCAACVRLHTIPALFYFLFISLSEAQPGPGGGSMVGTARGSGEKGVGLVRQWTLSPQLHFAHVAGTRCALETRARMRMNGDRARAPHGTARAREFLGPTDSGPNLPDLAPCFHIFARYDEKATGGTDLS
jgi:hypothetical protein